MSMTSNNPLKPRYNPLLWAQLRPSARSTVGDASQNVAPVIPLIPENKTNTSLRVVLHDTKSALEQFSDRLGKLVDGVEHAKREINKISTCFAEGHDKVLEELNAIVNRSQKGLLEALGFPAQAAGLEEVKKYQGENNRKLALLEDRTDLVQKQLHTISEQQGHILISLAAITPLAPLLKDSPQQQSQIVSTLTSLLPLLPLLQALPAQIQASQQAALKSFTTSMEVHRSASLPSLQFPRPLERWAQIPIPSDPRQEQHVKSKFPRPEVVDQHLHPGEINDGQRPASVIPSSRTLSSEPSHSSFHPTVKNVALTRRASILPDSSDPESSCNLPLSSDLGSATSPLKRPALVIDSSEGEIPRSHKHPRLEEPLSMGTQSTEVPSRGAVPRNCVTSSRPLRSDTSRPHSGKDVSRAPSRNTPFRTSTLPVRSPASIHRCPASVSSAPTPHAPGAFLQTRSTVPGRLLAATSYALNRTPTRAPLSTARRPMANGQMLMPPNCFPPSTRRHIIAPEVCAPSPDAQVSNLVETQSPEGGGKPVNNPLNGLDTSSSSQDLVPRKQLVRRNNQQRILLQEDVDEEVEIDLDWGDMAASC